MIDESSRKWINAPDVDVANISNKEDYMVMSYENRALDLDRLDAPPGRLNCTCQFISYFWPN